MKRFLLLIRLLSWKAAGAMGDSLSQNKESEYSSSSGHGGLCRLSLSQLCCGSSHGRPDKEVELVKVLASLSWCASRMAWVRSPERAVEKED